MMTGINGYNISPSQQRTWLLHKQGYALNTVLHATVNKPLTAAALAQMLVRIANRHESLRTTFRLPKNMLFPLQEVHEGAAPLVDLYDLGKEAPAVRRQKIATLIREKLSAPADLDANCLLEATLIDCGDEQQHLLLKAPAMIADIPSMLNILDEMAGYAPAGEPFQFAQYAEWQRELVTNPDEDAQAFWSAKEYPSFLDTRLALESSLLPEQQTEGSFFEWEPGISRYRQLTDRSVQYGVPVPVLLLACWYIVVWQYLDGSEDVVIGDVSLNRSFEEFESINGPLSKTLPVHIKLHPQLSYRELCRLVLTEQQTVRNWQDNFTWPAGMEKDHTGTMPACFPVCFEQVTVPAKDADALFNIKQVYSNTDLYKLKLSCTATQDALQLRLHYLSPFFNTGSITCIRQRFDAVLEKVLGNEDIRISALAGASEAEAGQYLLLNGKPVPYNAGSIPEMFGQQVLKHPGNIALTYLNREYTYQQLDEAATEFAAALQHRYGDLGKRTIAFRLSRSDKSIITMLGILKCGAAYLPVDMQTPPERIKLLLEDSDAVALVTEAGIEEIPDARVFIFSGNVLSDGVPYRPVNVQPDDTAYVIYTSGSTGIPKGVIIKHRSLCNYLNWYNSAYNITSHDSTLLLSSVAFDLCYTSLWTSLVSGAALHILEESPVFDGEAAIRALKERQVTYVKLTPSHFNVLVNSLSFEQEIPACKLRLVVLGGEEINTKDVDRFLQAKAGVTFVNHYGPTETTIGAIARTIENAEDWRRFKLQPLIGKPVFNNRVFILDEAGNILPAGITGEICIAGHGLGAGYLNRDDLTAARFPVHPCAGAERIYRTGDQGRLTAAGEIQFLGRRDFQVKVRGYRIELAEIENRLLAIAGISEAAVIAGRSTEDTRILAFYIAGDGVTETDIRAALKKYLPAYMLPDDYIPLRAFPLTENGKKDHKALIRIKGEKIRRAGKPAENRMQQQLVTIWKEVLEKEQVGIDEDFLDLGGHSLKAVQVVARVYKELNIKIELKELFASPTIEQLSELIAGREKSLYNNITPVEEQEYYHLSHAQKRLWIIEQLSAGSVVYNIPEYHRFSGRLDVPALEKAFRTVIDRHESLRTSFIVVDGVPRQRIKQPGELDFTIACTDLRQYEDREQMAAALAEKEAVTSFGLTNAPLIRVKLLRLDEELYLFMLTMHHIISDAWSSEILLEEVAGLYSFYTGSGGKALKPLRLQYKDYTVWQNKQLDGDTAADHKQYWLQQFKDIPRLHLHTDYPRPAVKTYNGDTIHTVLTAARSAGLNKLATGSGASLFMVMVAMVNALLYRYTGDEDIVIGCPVAGRPHPDLERQIGFYLNNLALRTRLNRNDTFSSLLEKVKTCALNGYEHAMYPFDLLVDALSIQRDQSRSPLFDVVVMLRNIEVTDHASTQLSGISLGGFQVAYKVSTIDLRLVFCEKGDNILFSIDYNTDLFRRASIEKFTRDFIEIVDDTLRNPQTGITAYALGENIAAKEEDLVTRFNF